MLTAYDGIGSESEAGGDKFEYLIWYDGENDEICITLFHYYSYGDSDMVMISINSSNNVCQFDYEYYLNDEELFFDGMGKIESASFNSSANIVFSKYEGNETDVPTAISNVKVLGDTMLNATAIILPQQIPGVELSMLGFVNYPA